MALAACAARPGSCTLAFLGNNSDLIALFSIAD
jgi:hypothetical protein